jgi:hypothetical protein
VRWRDYLMLQIFGKKRVIVNSDGRMEFKTRNGFVLVTKWEPGEESR